jgi:hypothetical protein
MMTSLRSKWAVGKAVRAGPALEGASRTIFTLAGEAHINRSVKMVRDVTDPAVAGQPPAHFQRNPAGRGQLAVFASGGRRTRLTRMNPDMGALPPVRLGPP